MKLQTKLFIIVFFLSSPISWSQENKKLDSLLTGYNKESDYQKKLVLARSIFETTLKSDPKLALQYAYRSSAISEQHDYLKGKAWAFKSLEEYYSEYRNNDSILHYIPKAANAFERLGNKEMQLKSLIIWSKMEMKMGDFDTAIDIANEAYSVGLKIKKGVFISEALEQKAAVYMRTGEYEKTIELFVSALRICDTLAVKDPKKESVIISGIGVIESRLGNAEEAIQRFEEALVVFDEFSDIYWQTVLNFELGIAYSSLEEYDEALRYLEQSRSYATTMKRKDFMAECNMRMSSIYIEQKRYQEALVLIKEAIQVTKELGAKSDLAIGFKDLATIYLKQEKFPEAINYYNKAINLSDSISADHTLMESYEKRAVTYKKMGFFKKAFADLEAYNIVKDSVFNTTKSAQIEKLKTAYDTEKKEQQISQQETEINLLEEQKKVSNLQKMILGGGLGLSLVALGFGFYGFKQRTKRTRLEKEKVEAELAFKKKELTTHALHLAKKNEVLEEVKQKAKELKSGENIEKGYQTLVQTINFDQQDDKAWENFTQYFEAVHKDFTKQIVERYPDISKNELRLMALLKMSMSSKEIANILNISADGVKKARQRLRKKMKLTPEDSLETTVMSI